MAVPVIVYSVLGRGLVPVSRDGAGTAILNKTRVAIADARE
ncbi:hypothetical protein [Haloechinothrix alba]|nr:hypothetical protein [Haloechinothrix alba]